MLWHSAVIEIIGVKVLHAFMDQHPQTLISVPHGHCTERF